MEGIIQTLNEWAIFLKNFGACLLAIFVFEVIKDAINKNVSIFATYKNTRLYCLSFVYEIARNLKLEGKSDDEIQKDLLRRYKDKSLPFMMSLQHSTKMVDAINFVGIVLNDANLLFTYVATPSFGKDSYKVLLSKVNLSDEERDAEFALKDILIDESDENVQRCKKWLPVLCTKPFVEDLPDCGDNDKGGRNEAMIFALLRPSEREIESPSTFVFKSGASERGFVDCLLKLQKCYPSMEVVKLTAFNRQFNLISGGGQDARTDKRRIYLNRIKIICPDFGE